MAVAVAVVGWPSVSAYAAYPWVKYLPYALFAGAGILGMVLGQGRVFFIGVLLAAITLLAQRFGFADGDDVGSQVVVLVASIIAPIFTAAFYWMRERSVLTSAWLMRVAAVTAVILVLSLSPSSSVFRELVPVSSSSLAAPMSKWLAVPAAGLLCLALSSAALLVRNRWDGPHLGGLLLMAVVFVFGALNFRSAMLPYKATAQAWLVCFMSASGVLLCAAVLESSWRTAMVDDLTELPGRRALSNHFGRLGARYMVAMLDLDHFKQINDTYGHQTGDQALRFVAARLRDSGVGTAYRYGGEEFVVVCEGCDAKEGATRMEEVRKLIGGTPFGIRGKDRPGKKPEKAPAQKAASAVTINITVSVGVAQNGSADDSPMEVLRSADKALYRSKRDGRNRVTVAGS